MTKILTSREFVDLPPSQIVPRLADQGKYIASESSFYKLLKERKLQAHRGKSRAPSKHPLEALMATAPNQIYSWDITYLRSPIKGVYYYLYMFMDVFSRKIVGYEVYEEESMEHSSELINSICIKENIDEDQLVLHSDNGGPMKGATMLATLEKLGVAASFSRPRVSNDNPYSESLFKTLKYRPEYPNGPFRSIEEAKQWVIGFVDWYNNEHLHSGIKFVTPNDRHEGRDEYILNRRKIVYETAKLARPDRWSRNVKDFEREEKVFLNHLPGRKKFEKKEAS